MKSGEGSEKVERDEKVPAGAVESLPSEGGGKDAEKTRSRRRTCRREGPSSVPEKSLPHVKQASSRSLTTSAGSPPVQASGEVGPSPEMANRPLAAPRRKRKEKKERKGNGPGPPAAPEAPTSLLLPKQSFPDFVMLRVAPQLGWCGGSGDMCALLLRPGLLPGAFDLSTPAAGSLHPCLRRSPEAVFWCGLTQRRGKLPLRRKTKKEGVGEGIC